MDRINGDVFEPVAPVQENFQVGEMPGTVVGTSAHFGQITAKCAGIDFRDRTVKKAGEIAQCTTVGGNSTLARPQFCKSAKNSWIRGYKG
ncbi:hypothetical protein Psch_02716 [Pelotomaculum schinkii]|uniref:Uncharacterized protein n=1 Tax=Pelotomaculum schinkii TaxID=78350 RepID=A0A4Y7R9P9_9FIRM|nr:hypothetical protein [Pelotomaculum schinkii]TEB05675.1 hypothetical protein Psch_02716 [Pelotomaculum schinkii]